MTLHSVRRAAAHPTLRLVLLHGYGSDEWDMLGLAEELPADIDVICLRAPDPLEHGGYAWFDISVGADGFGYDEEGFRMAIALVLSALPDLHAGDVPFVMGGFSQGAMVSAAVTLVSPDVDAAWLMSGAMPPVAELLNARPRPVLVQHGEMDQVLPFELGRDLAKRLKEVGMEVSAKKYPMGHSVSAESLADAIEWLTSLTEKVA